MKPRRPARRAAGRRPKLTHARRQVGRAAGRRQLGSVGCRRLGKCRAREYPGWWRQHRGARLAPHARPAHGMRARRPASKPGWTAAHAIQAGGVPIAVLAIDIPFVSQELLRSALESVARGASIVAPRWQDRWHPLCAAYAPGMLEPLQARLDAGDLDLQGFLDEWAIPIGGKSCERSATLTSSCSTSTRPRISARQKKVVAKQRARVTRNAALGWGRGGGSSKKNRRDLAVAGSP